MSDFLSKEDYEEPCCPLKMKNTGERIPVGRVLSRLDEFLSRNDYSSAEKLLNYWYEEAKVNGDTRGEMTILNEKVGIYRKTGKKDECLSAVSLCRELLSDCEFKGTVTEGTTLLNCATAFCAFECEEKALPLYMAAAVIYEKYLKESDARLGGLYNNTAICLMRLKKYDDAKLLFEKALKIMAGVPNGEAEMAVTYCNMADLVSFEKGLVNGEDEINRYLEKAEALLNTETLARDGNYAFVCEKCAGTFGYYGFFMTEKELLKRAREIYERN